MNEIKILMTGFAIITAAGFLLNTAAFGDGYGYDNNPCKGGLKVFAYLEGNRGIFAENLKVTFSSNGYSNSKIVPSNTPEVGYHFHEGTVPEYGEFRVTLRNLESNQVVSTTGYNSAGCHPEYVSMRIPQ
jgi:hypothetical protein